MTDNGPAEVDVVHVYCEPDDVGGESGWWIACVDVLGRAAVDANGRSPTEAFARLAEKLAERLYDPDWEARAARESAVSCSDCSTAIAVVEAFAIRPAEGRNEGDGDVFWLCQRCWDSIVSGALLSRLRGM